MLGLNTQFRKSQTRRKTGTENHGSLRDSRVAWKQAALFFAPGEPKQI
jgi:hypothetical protein